MNSLDRFAQEKLAALEAQGLRRRLAADERLAGVRVNRAGRELVSFSCNDYLNLSFDPRVREAAAAAALAYGAGAGASRLITGNHPLVRALEEKLARMKGAEGACVFGAGYLANIGIAPSLVREGDAIFIDALAHSCLWSGARLSRAEVITFRHNDAEHLASLLDAHRGAVGHALVLTESVFSMDGDLAPLDDISRVCQAHDAWLLCDDAHGLGVIGEGRGAAAAFPGAHIHLQMGTLSKAAGSYGGYVCASAAVIDLLINRARSFVFSTGISPANAAAAIAALDIIESEPDRVARPLAHARRFTRALGFAEAQSAIVPVVLGAPQAALAGAARLAEAGYLVVPIRPPTVPENTSRLRFAFSAGHDEADIDRVAQIVREIMV